MHQALQILHWEIAEAVRPNLPGDLLRQYLQAMRFSLESMSVP